MSINFASDQQVKAYAEFFERFQALNEGKICQIGQRHVVAKKIPGLFALFASFSAYAVRNRKKKSALREWNPIAQRVYCSLPIEFKSKTLTSDFDQAIDLISRFIELSHESMHVLSWEPFFVGRMKKLSRKRFITHMLLSEGFCFWYADIIVTRLLRVKLKDGEFVRARNAVSQGDFHPYRAFKAMGMTNTLEILDVYLDTFNGDRTKLYYKRKMNYVRDLFARFCEFYLSSLQPVKHLYKQLDEVGIFDDFQQRFCLEGLPTLLPDALLDSVDQQEYYRRLYKTGMKHVATLPYDTLCAVKLRRSIQLRGYTAYSLKFAIQKKLLFSRNQTPIRSQELSIALDAYLTILEHSLVDLQKGKPLDQVRKKMMDADRRYNKTIQADFLKAQVWLKMRRSILPYVSIPYETIDKNQWKTTKEYQTNVLKLLKLGIKHGFSDTKLSKDRMELLNKINVLIKIAGSKQQKPHNSWVSAINEYMLDKHILPMWSLEVGTINPVANYFRELLFIYV